MAVIMVSSINPNVLVPISKGEYVAYEDDFNVLFSSNQLTRLFRGPGTLIWFIIKLVGKTIRSEKGAASRASFIFEVIWKFLIFVLPDFLLT